MSPRAAWRLDSISFEQVYDYVAGKADWGSYGLPLEGAEGSETRVGAYVRTDVPNCRLDDRLQEVCARLEEGGWDTCFVLHPTRRRFPASLHRRRPAWWSSVSWVRPFSHGGLPRYDRTEARSSSVERVSVLQVHSACKIELETWMN